MSVAASETGSANGAEAAHELRSASFPGRIIFGFVSFTLFAIVVVWSQLGSPWGPLASTVLAWLLFGVHVALARRYLGPFDPRLWIPVVILLFYFGMPIAVELLAATEMDYDALDIGAPPQLARAFATALLTLSALLFGFHLAGLRRTRGITQTSAGDRRRFSGPSLALLGFGLIMMLAGIAIAGPSTIFGSYSTLMRSRQFAVEETRFFGVGLAFSKVAVLALLAIHDRKRPMTTWLALATGGFLLVIMVLTGARGQIAGFALGAGFIFSQRVFRTRTRYVVVAFLAAFLTMPVLKEFREHRSVSDTTQLGIRELATSTFYEMGATVTAFTYTIEHIPRDKPYDWGLSFVNAVLNAIPNLTLDPGKSFVLHPIKHGPSKWLVWQSNPRKFEAHGGGYGYALGAEWYFNFGFVGVLLGMTLIGWGIGKLVNSSRASAAALIVSGVVLQTLAILVRNNLGAPLKHASWPLIGLWLLVVAWPFRARPRPEWLEAELARTGDRQAGPTSR